MLDIFTHSALNDVEFIYVLNYLLALSLSIVMTTPSSSLFSTSKKFQTSLIKCYDFNRD